MATGDILSITIGSGTLTDAYGRAMWIDSYAAIKIEGMGRRIRTDPVPDFSSLRIVVTCPGFDATGTATTFQRNDSGGRFPSVKGRMGIPNPYPKFWLAATAGQIWAANSYCAFGTGAAGTMYYTVAGGTSTSAANPPADGGVTWVAVGTEQIAGYFSTVSGSDIIVYASLDNFIFGSDTVVSASISAGAYQAGGNSSLASASIPIVTNSSTLAYPPPIVQIVERPHERIIGGSYSPEFTAKHVLGPIAAVKARAYDSAVANPTSFSPIVTTATTSAYSTASTQIGTLKVEVWKPTVDVSGLAAGNAYLQHIVYPSIGDVYWDSFRDGEGRAWVASTAYSRVGEVIRNGANFYTLVTPGTSAGSGGPTGTAAGITDGSCFWNGMTGTDRTKPFSGNPQWGHHFYNDPLNKYSAPHFYISPTGTCTGQTGMFDTEAAMRAATPWVTNANAYASESVALPQARIFNNAAAGRGLTAHDDIGGSTAWYLGGNSTGYNGFGAGTLGALVTGAVWNESRVDTANGGTSEWYLASGGTANNLVPTKRHLWGKGFTHITSAVLGTSPLRPQTDNTTTFDQCVGEVAIEGVTMTMLSTQVIVLQPGLVWYRNSTFNNFFLNGVNTRGHTVQIIGCKMIAQDLNSQNVTVTCSNVIGNYIKGKLPHISRTQTAGNSPATFYVGSDNYLQGNTATTGGKMITLLQQANMATQGATWDGNLIEVLVNNVNNDKCGEIGADASVADLSNVLIANNTHIGGRFNMGYNDAPNYPKRSLWVSSNNIMREWNSVQGYEYHVSGNRDGTRHMNMTYSLKTGHSADVVFVGDLTNGTFLFSPVSLNGFQICPDGSINQKTTGAAIATQFVNDQTGTDGGATPGVGSDYTPAAGAIAIGFAKRQWRTYDMLGALRSSTGAVGAFAFAGEGAAGGGRRSPSLRLGLGLGI